jgi:hypothetical protein
LPKTSTLSNELSLSRISIPSITSIRRSLIWRRSSLKRNTRYVNVLIKISKVLHSFIFSTTANIVGHWAEKEDWRPERSEQRTKRQTGTYRTAETVRDNGVKFLAGEAPRSSCPENQSGRINNFNNRRLLFGHVYVFTSIGAVD